MCVHLYGHPCDMEQIVELAKSRNLFVIEDCAEAFGSKYKGKYVGTFGDISTFSFLEIKLLLQVKVEWLSRMTKHFMTVVYILKAKD